MNVKKLVALAAMAVGMSAQASSVILPGANEMSAALYGDFTVYSLDLLAQCRPTDARCNPYVGDQGPLLDQVKAQQLNDQMIIYRNENGAPTSNYVGGPLTPGTLATSGVDNPFNAPTGGVTTFDMSTANEPTGEAFATGCGSDFAHDKCGTWEAKLSTVQDYISGNEVIFLFDNNQQGNDQSQQQFFWATLQILDANGNAIGGLCYELTAGTTDCALNPAYTSIASPGEFVGSGGGFCVDRVSGASYLLAGNAHPTSQGDCGADYFVNNNLGQNNAEFAVTLDELNQNLAAWAAAGYSMSINFKMRNLNDGGEQLWICSDCSRDTTDLPEPGSLALVGLALMTLGALRRRA